MMSRSTGKWRTKNFSVSRLQKTIILGFISFRMSFIPWIIDRCILMLNSPVVGSAVGSYTQGLPTKTCCFNCLSCGCIGLVMIPCTYSKKVCTSVGSRLRPKRAGMTSCVAPRHGTQPKNGSRIFVSALCCVSRYRSGISPWRSYPWMMKPGIMMRALGY